MGFELLLLCLLFYIAVKKGFIMSEPKLVAKEFKVTWNNHKSGKRIGLPDMDEICAGDKFLCYVDKSKKPLQITYTRIEE